MESLPVPVRVRRHLEARVVPARPYERGYGMAYYGRTITEHVALEVERANESHPPAG